ncbi:hypothetical protein EJ02DRAFT_508171 [Clathrospora elynae]|uniref:Uncharacterized protein n=1 Tax=Clathrospora elynae TaxID=706981 RepID=A0A6A5T1Y1_9PLEO|nr:hypothetical protein EJ02DRAFT_508171 [Clathrospora elynae]
MTVITQKSGHETTFTTTMPIKWTAELEAILLHGVFEECNISFSRALCAKITERVNAAGMEFTHKAVENRLYRWKKKIVSSSPVLNANTPNTPAKSIPTKISRPRPKATPKMKKGSEFSDDDGPQYLMDDDEMLASPSAARGKRAAKGKKVAHAEAEGTDSEEEKYISMAKRVKTEPVEKADAELFTGNLEDDGI